MKKILAFLILAILLVPISMDFKVKAAVFNDDDMGIVSGANDVERDATYIPLSYFTRSAYIAGTLIEGIGDYHGTIHGGLNVTDNDYYQFYLPFDTFVYFDDYATYENGTTKSNNMNYKLISYVYGNQKIYNDEQLRSGVDLKAGVYFVNIDSDDNYIRVKHFLWYVNKYVSDYKVTINYKPESTKTFGSIQIDEAMINNVSGIVWKNDFDINGTPFNYMYDYEGNQMISDISGTVNMSNFLNKEYLYKRVLILDEDLGQHVNKALIASLDLIDEAIDEYNINLQSGPYGSWTVYVDGLLNGINLVNKATSLLKITVPYKFVLYLPGLIDNYWEYSFNKHQELLLTMTVLSELAANNFDEEAIDIDKCLEFYNIIYEVVVDTVINHDVFYARNMIENMQIQIEEHVERGFGKDDYIAFDIIAKYEIQRDAISASGESTVDIINSILYFKDYDSGISTDPTSDYIDYRVGSDEFELPFTNHKQNGQFVFYELNREYNYLKEGTFTFAYNKIIEYDNEYTTSLINLYKPSDSFTTKQYLSISSYTYLRNVYAYHRDYGFLYVYIDTALVKYNTPGTYYAKYYVKKPGSLAKLYIGQVTVRVLPYDGGPILVEF